ncbi:hypothetical protein FB384_004227 [Prauserella sediminis]|uniref:Uncharacterized protein n=1 Tax=Prauserella sediminis TaxID=577680 RepID=A0A839XV61_9PSEU|nr:hypothetical protein [Prauserella sediminis]MBB3665274.1 hypothetical protein [Prauserella sediminis]
MTGFHVSVPDLRGFGGQVGELGTGYTALGKGIGDKYTSALETADVKNQIIGGVGVLAPALVALQDQCDALMGAHISACKVMSESLEATDERLVGAANDYEGKDLEAEAELRKADPSEGAEATADAITRGSANESWGTDYNVDDYLTEDLAGTVIPEMAFKPTLESAKQALDKAGGGWFSKVEAVVEYFCGFSPSEEIVKPLIGDWGVLWYVADLHQGAAKAVNELSNVMYSGADALLGEYWAGDAADDFCQWILANWWRELHKHGALFDRSAARLNEIAHKLQADGQKIADGLLSVADIALDIALALRGAGKKGPVNPVSLVKDLGEAGYALGESLGTLGLSLYRASNTTLAELTSDLAKLNPPLNLKHYQQ